MTDALLPSDPSKDGRYWWLRAPNGLAVPAQWRGYGWKVFGQPVAYGAQFMAEQGYSLASPHPIPTPEQLDALHALPVDMVRRAKIDAAGSGLSEEQTRYWVQSAVCYSADLIVTLGAKPAPNDPPGNGLDDVRAAAMDGWGGPRAGEEAAP